MVSMRLIPLLSVVVAAEGYSRNRQVYAASASAAFYPHVAALLPLLPHLSCYYFEGSPLGLGIYPPHCWFATHLLLSKRMNTMISITNETSLMSFNHQ